jgi:succinate dehydrogenase/fumarate reductase flavoprotein subunit
MEQLNAVKHIKADLAVLVTGGAGIASVITASEGVAKTVISEKSPFPGGAFQHSSRICVCKK